MLSNVANFEVTIHRVHPINAGILQRKIINLPVTTALFKSLSVNLKQQI